MSGCPGATKALCKTNKFRIVLSDVLHIGAAVIMVITLAVSSSNPREAFSWTKVNFPPVEGGPHHLPLLRLLPPSTSRRVLLISDPHPSSLLPSLVSSHSRVEHWPQAMANLRDRLLYDDDAQVISFLHLLRLRLLH